MKTKMTLLTLLITFGILLIFSSGCYTQLGSTRSAYDDDQEYTEYAENVDTTYVAENEDDSYTYNYESSYCDDYRPRVGFSYYYPSSYWPSTAFSVAYANPWAYDYYWGIDPYSYYYSPYAGHSFYWYPSYFYSPYYYGYGDYYYSDNWSRRSKRTDGSMRSYNIDRNTTTTGYGVNNTSRFNDDLPSAAGYRNAPGGTVTTDRRSATVPGNTRATTNQRTYGRRDARTAARTNDANSRGTGQRNVVPRRTDRPRGTQPQSRPPESRPSSPPSYQPPARENRGSTPSYTPPSAAPSRQPSSPPPSNDGGRRTDGNSRGSGSRDKKP